MAASDVINYGTDSSGRTIYLTRYMADWWEAIVHELGFTPTIVQGAFMVRNGGGASASAGYHDGGGCIDLRVWDLTDAQQVAVVHAIRWGGGAVWKRDTQHGGMDEHFHIVLGSDYALAPGAAWQWLNYLNGGDGLTGNGRDYHPRPSPLVTTPPDSLMEEPVKQEDIAAIVAALTPVIKEAVAGNKLDVGRKSKLSDDTVAEALLSQVKRLNEKVASLETALRKSQP